MFFIHPVGSLQRLLYALISLAAGHRACCVSPMKMPTPQNYQSVLALAALGLLSLPAPLLSAAIPSPAGPHHFRNLSSRAVVQTGSNVLIGGFIINGTGSKQVLVRALGPSLAVNGQPLQGRLADPTLELYSSGNGTPIATNDNWKSSQQAQITATGLAPGSDLDSAILITLDPGQYTAVVRGKSGATGLSVVEMYEQTDSLEPKLANISTRGLVQSGDNILIGGLIVGGGNSDASTLRVILRALGPGLAGAGVTGTLPDPTLQVVDENGTTLASNDDWREGSARFELEASGFAPTNDAEPALILILSGGKYTALVRGKDGASGIALIEAYDVPESGGPQ